MFRRLYNKLFSIGLLGIALLIPFWIPVPVVEEGYLAAVSYESEAVKNSIASTSLEFVGPEPYKKTTIRILNPSPAIDFLASPSTLVRYADNSVYAIADINEAGSVYAVIYNADPGVLTSAQIKDHANGIGSP